MKLGSALKTAGILVVVLGLASVCFAGDSKTITVKATIPQNSSLSVSISKIIDNVWYPNQPSVDFGTLTYDSTHHIFRANCYYAVDVGVISNAATWSVTHTPHSVIRTNGTEKLDSNINVTFVRQISDTSSSPLPNGKVSFANSNRSFTKFHLLGGWLRIYYGIASGSGDNPGVSPITKDKPHGTYQGSVVLTLTP